jgi:hypothetical protein
MPSSRYQIVAQLDPRTMQPIQQPSTGVVQPTSQTQQGGQQQGAQQQQGGFNIDQFAAESAANQMNWAAAKGARLTMEDFENARKAAWSAAADTQRQIAMEKQRNQDELTRQIAMKQVEETMVKRMSEGQLKDASGLMTAPSTIMNLYNLHQDATKLPGYGQAVVGTGANKVYDLTDPRVRLYNAAQEGSMVSLARGLMEDTGQAASKESSQAQIRNMMPNDQDNAQMGGIKTVSMLQMTLDKMAAKIRGLRDDNVDATPLQNAYTQAYNQYKGLVQNVGTDAQKAHPSASPDEVFGGGEAQKTYLAQGPQPIQPVVKAGLSQPSQDTINAVNARAAGQQPTSPVWQPGPEVVQRPPPPPITPEEPRPQSMAPGLGTISGAPADTGRSPAAPASTAGISWLQGLLPQDFQTESQQYVGYGT